MGLEGLVSKHRDRPYRGGRCRHFNSSGILSRGRAAGDRPHTANASKNSQHSGERPYDHRHEDHCRILLREVRRRLQSGAAQAMDRAR